MIRPLAVSITAAETMVTGKKTQIRIPVQGKFHENRGKKAVIPSDAEFTGIHVGKFVWERGSEMYSITAPYQVGDILYVREPAHRVCVIKTLYLGGEESCTEEFFGWRYMSDHAIILDEDDAPSDLSGDEFHTYEVIDTLGWLPATQVPKAAARRFLEVVSIEVEHLQNISATDIVAEGIPDEWPMAPIFCPECRGEGVCGAIGSGMGYMEVDCPKCDTDQKRFRNYWYEKFGWKSPLLDWENNPWVWKITFKESTPLKLDSKNNWIV